ncbi:MAG: UDP-2,4-diacetamido-2,4,6-trideoxy-beta-L-altropyranose hydrolase, partial [Burkholderiales bacterium PBB5]
MNLVLRADGGLAQGAGHLMRCLSLASALRERGAVCRFIGRAEPGHALQLVADAGFALHHLPVEPGPLDEAADAAATAALLQRWPASDWLLVDHYRLGLAWEQALRPWVRRLAVIDDLSDRAHDADLLLDQNLDSGGLRQRPGLLPAPCQRLIGPAYALLRPEFAELRAQHAGPAGRHTALRRLLVFYTAGHDLGETWKALQGVAGFAAQARRAGLPPLQVDVVAGPANPQQAEISALCTQWGWTLHGQTPHIAQLMAEADLALGAGGASNWERCALGLPALVTVLAENQAAVAQALHQAGAVRCLGWGHRLSAADYHQALAALDGPTLQALAKRAATL